MGGKEIKVVFILTPFHLFTFRLLHYPISAMCFSTFHSNLKKVSRRTTGLRGFKFFNLGMRDIREYVVKYHVIKVGRGG